MASPGRDAGAPPSAASPEWFLAGLVAAAMIDGRIDPKERALLERACAALGLGPDELQRQIDACATRMRPAA
jgi:uncharacterized membrane protein YebE (DUF533 family)